MTTSSSPNQSAVLAVLRLFLQSVLPPAVEIVRGQDNRVAEPQTNDFVVMTPILRPRLATNIDTYQDCSFVASIAPGTGIQATFGIMVVSNVILGAITLGNALFGPGIAAGTVIVAFLLGKTPGGPGTYSVSIPQTVASQKMACGAAVLEQDAEWIVQLDIHGPGSADNATIISTAFRDQYAYDYFVAQNANVTPIAADDPKQVPFTNDQNQVEWRWIVEARMQVNASLALPQDFADTLTLSLEPLAA